MESGALTRDNFSQVLREISSRRKNGVLGILLPKGKVGIFCSKGKIVDFKREGVSPESEIVEILKRASMLEPGYRTKATSLKELFEELAGAGAAISDDGFKSIVKHRLLDRLYELDLNSKANFAFEARIVEPESEFSPAISPGQVLLDIVSLESDRERFLATFPSGVKLLSVSAVEQPSEEELAILGIIGEQGATLADVQAGAMLSRFHLQDTLLSLHERGVIQIEESIAVQPEPHSAVESSDGEEEELDEKSSKSNRKSRDFSAFNNYILQAHWVPDIVVSLLATASLAAPFLWWNGF